MQVSVLPSFPARDPSVPALALGKELFLSGIDGVADCGPPDDFGPGVTTALFPLSRWNSASRRPLSHQQQDFGFSFTFTEVARGAAVPDLST